MASLESLLEQGLEDTGTGLGVNGVYRKVRNTTGSTIGKRRAVYLSGYDSGTGLPLIALARTNAAATANCFGVTAGSIANNADGYVIQRGVLENVNTFNIPTGTPLWVSAIAAGDYEQYRAHYSAPVGYVIRQSADGVEDGSIFVDVGEYTDPGYTACFGADMTAGSTGNFLAAHGTSASALATTLGPAAEVCCPGPGNVSAISFHGTSGAFRQWKVHKDGTVVLTKILATAASASFVWTNPGGVFVPVVAGTLLAVEWDSGPHPGPCTVELLIR